MTMASMKQQGFSAWAMTRGGQQCGCTDPTFLSALILLLLVLDPLGSVPIFISVMGSAVSDASRCMRKPHCRRGQDCSDVVGLPVSGRP